MRRGKQVLGTTPYEAAEDKGTKSFDVTLERKGFKPISQRIAFAENWTHRLVLEAIKPPSPPVAKKRKRTTRANTAGDATSPTRGGTMTIEDTLPP